jgi:hypothetical protein
MKTSLLTLAVLSLCLNGCTNLKVTKVAENGSSISFKATSLFSNTVLRGLGVDATTKTTTNLLKLSTSATEPNPESITATGSALGELIGTAAKASIKP